MSSAEELKLLDEFARQVNSFPSWMNCKKNFRVQGLEFDEEQIELLAKISVEAISLAREKGSGKEMTTKKEYLERLIILLEELYRGEYFMNNEPKPVYAMWIKILKKEVLVSEKANKKEDL